MFGRPQAQSSRTENHRNINEAAKCTMPGNTGMVQKPKTRRGGVEVRARAARRAQRLALEEQQRAEEKARGQATAEAAENGIGIGRMRHALHEYRNNAETIMGSGTMRRDEFLTHTNRAGSVMSFGWMRHDLHRQDNRVPGEEAIPSSARIASSDDGCANTAERERGAGGELELGVVDGGCGRCLCTLVCVCIATRCSCVDMCHCD
jgi:hypothetical protein